MCFYSSMIPQKMRSRFYQFWNVEVIMTTLKMVSVLLIWFPVESESSVVSNSSRVNGSDPVRTVSENENPVDESNSAIPAPQMQPTPHPNTSLSNVQEDHQDENMKVSPNHIFAVPHQSPSKSHSVNFRWVITSRPNGSLSKYVINIQR